MAGERIQFDPNVNFVFETHDLSCASPATISRMGMIFLSEEDMSIQTVIDAWMGQQAESPNKQRLHDLLSDHLANAICWIADNVEDGAIVETQSRLGLAHNALSLLTTSITTGAFACALMRGLGGPLPYADRDAFAKVRSPDVWVTGNVKRDIVK